MTEYTPPTEQVREIYAEIRHEGTGQGFKPHRAEFDRWLNEIKAEAWDEGSRAEADRAWRQEDANAAGQWHLVPDPKNPYREEPTDD